MTAVLNSQILLVEGLDDKRVVEHLLKAWGKDPKQHFKIEQKSGVDNLLASIPSHIKESGLKTLGILVDANNDIGIRWQAISDRLSKAECENIPSKPESDGIIFDGWRGSRIGIWLMPNNQCKGELENFIYEMIPSNDSVLPRTKEYIDNIPRADRKFKDQKLVRAYVYAWLATREKPHPMGLAIKTRDLDKNADEARRFYEWSRKLFQF